MKLETEVDEPSAADGVLSWDLVGAFLAVAKTGSLSGGSRALGVAQPTVRRQIERLEEVLGVALFTRSPTGLAPTEAALAALPYAESMSGVADALVRSVSGSSTGDEGTVRISASEVLGVEVLPAILSDLLDAHPRLSIELSATNANEDILRRDADVAVRMAQPTQGALVVKRVAAIEIGLFASEAYVKRRGLPRSVAELSKGHALIGRDRDASFFAAIAAAGIGVKRRGFAFRTDSDPAQVSAIRAGLGIGICQSPLARRSGLVRVVPKVRFELPVWIVTHEDLRASRRVALVFDHLARALEAYATSTRAATPRKAPARSRSR